MKYDLLTNIMVAIHALLLAMLVGCTATSGGSLGFNITPKQLEARQIIVTLSEDYRDQWQQIHQDILDHFDVQPAGQFPLKSIRVNCLVYRVFGHG